MPRYSRPVPVANCLTFIAFFCVVEYLAFLTAGTIRPSFLVIHLALRLTHTEAVLLMLLHIEVTLMKEIVPSSMMENQTVG